MTVGEKQAEVGAPRPEVLDGPFSTRQLLRIDEALRLADQGTGLIFSVYVGELDEPVREHAERLHRQLADPDRVGADRRLAEPAAAGDRHRLGTRASASPTVTPSWPRCPWWRPSAAVTWPAASSAASTSSPATPASPDRRTTATSRRPVTGPGITPVTDATGAGRLASSRAVSSLRRCGRPSRGPSAPGPRRRGPRRPGGAAAPGGPAAASHASVAATVSVVDLVRRVGELDELLRRLAVAAGPDLVDHGEVLLPVRRGQLDLRRVLEALQQRPVPPVRQRLVAGQLGARPRPCSRRSASAPARSAASRSPLAVRSRSSSASISAGAGRPVGDQRRQHRPAQLGVDGQPGRHLGAVEPAAQRGQVLVGAGGRRRTPGPRRAGSRCPARRRRSACAAVRGQLGPAGRRPGRVGVEGQRGWSPGAASR